MSSRTTQQSAPAVMVGLVLAILAGGLGLIAGQSPLVALAIGGLVCLCLMPWPVLMVLFALAAAYSRSRVQIAGVSLQYSHAVLIPLAFRTLLLTNRRLRNRWGWQEWALIGFVALQFVSSFVMARNLRLSMAAAGLLALGGATYLVVYTGLCTRERLILAARWILFAALLNATLGLLGVVLHFGGIDYFIAGHPGSHKFFVLPKGLSPENNIYGSFTAAAAMAFYVLMRERNPLFSKRFATLAFWLCLLGTFLAATRAAWIGFIVGFVALLFFRQRRMRHQSPAGGMGVLAVMVGVAAVGALWLSSRPPTTAVDAGATSPGSAYSQSANGLLNFGEGTGANRLTEWKTALQDVTRSPLIGWGTNSYGQHHLALSSTEKNPVPGYLGSLYFRTLYDSGILGFVLLMFFLVGVVWPNRALQRSTSDIAPVARAFVFSYVVLGVAFAATDASFQPWPWIILGCARAASSFVLRQHAATRRAQVAAWREAAGAGVAPVPSLAGNGAPPRAVGVRRAPDRGASPNGGSSAAGGRFPDPFLRRGPFAPPDPDR